MGRKNKKWRAKKMAPLHLHKSFDGYSFNLLQSELANYRSYRQIQFKKKMKKWYNRPFALFVEVVDDFKEEASNYSPNDEWYVTYIFVPVVIFFFFCILLIYLVSIYAVIQLLIGLPIGIIAWKKRKRIRGLLYEYFSWEPVMIEVEINRNKQVIDRMEKTLHVKKNQFTSFDQQISTHKNKKLEAKYGEKILEKSQWYQDTIQWLEYCINGLKENNSELQIRKTLWEADYKSSQHACPSGPD
jgi:hypothetical protein